MWDKWDQLENVEPMTNSQKALLFGELRTALMFHLNFPDESYTDDWMREKMKELGYIQKSRSELTYMDARMFIEWCENKVFNHQNPNGTIKNTCDCQWCLRGDNVDPEQAPF